METFDNGHTPFSETIGTNRFFPGARRREILEELKSAITGSVTLLTLTGEEGSGKTMMCRMLESELPAGYVLVLLPRTLDSFEDVTRAIAQEMNITLADGVAIGDIRALLLEVWERLAEKKQKMLIVIDQAERIYLATLERIRKMLDIMNQTGIVLQILFSGAPSLLDNLKQLSVCSFQGAEQKDFFLEPLDSSATYAYLNFRMNDGRIEENEAFSQDASERIFSLAGGNMRKTNRLAEESLQIFPEDTPDAAPIDNAWETPQEEPEQKWNIDFLQEKYLTWKKWLIPVGGCLAVLVLLLLLRGGKTPDIHEKKQAPELEKLSAEIRDIQKKAEEIKAQAAQPDAAQPPAVEKEQVKTETTPPPVEKEQVKTVTAPPPIEKEQVKAVTAPPTAAAPMTTREEVPDKKQIVEKVKELEKKKEIITIGPPPDKAKPAKPEPPVSEKPPHEKVSIDQLFNARIAMAAKWLIGEKNDHYTIQLMVLASEGAENNAKKMLAQKDYQDIANKLFFLRKSAATPTVLVFYGEYPTMIEARNARNSLPEFLLKHNPYAISVRGAVEKAN